MLKNLETKPKHNQAVQLPSTIPANPQGDKNFFTSNATYSNTPTSKKKMKYQTVGKTIQDGNPLPDKVYQSPQT